MRTALALIITLALSANHSQARIVHIPSYDELFSKADVILIVRPGETRDAQGDDVTQPLGVSDLDDYVTAVVTPLTILRVVKGDFKQKEMDLPHYRLDTEKAARKGHGGLGNGPALVVFAQKDENVNEFDDLPCERDYMLFMKKLKDGQLQFYTGQFDPKFSVFRLSPRTQEGG